MNRFIKYSDITLHVLRLTFVGFSGVALLFLTVMTTADTFMRFVFNNPFPASVEISQLIQPYIVFLPFAFALNSKSHVRVTLFTEKIKGRFRLVIEFIPYLIGTIFFSVMTYISWIRFYDSFKINETMLAAIRLYWWIGKFAMPLGLGLITLEFISQGIRSFVDIIKYQRKVS